MPLNLCYDNTAVPYSDTEEGLLLDSPITLLPGHVLTASAATAKVP